MNEVPIDDAIERKFPEWIVMIVATDEEGTPNAMPAGWMMFTSGDPTMLAVSVGHTRYTHELLRNATEFVVTYPSVSQREAVAYCGTNSGADVEKFEETDLETAPASVVETPLIEDSSVCFECEKRGTLETGDHTIFSGEIVASHVSENEKIYNLGAWTEHGVESFAPVGER